MSGASGAVLVIAVLAVYFLPTIVASSRRLKVADGIFILNLTLGWTVLGWLGGLIWSVSAQDRRAVRVPV